MINHALSNIRTLSLINALGTVLEPAIFDTNTTSTRLIVFRGKFDLMLKVHTTKWKKFASNN